MQMQNSNSEKMIGQQERRISNCDKLYLTQLLLPTYSFKRPASWLKQSHSSWTSLTWQTWDQTGAQVADFSKSLPYDKDTHTLLFIIFWRKWSSLYQANFFHWDKVEFWNLYTWRRHFWWWTLVSRGTLTDLWLSKDSCTVWYVPPFSLIKPISNVYQSSHLVGSYSVGKAFVNCSHC